MTKCWETIKKEVQEVNDSCLEKLIAQYFGSSQQVTEVVVKLLSKKLQNYEFDATWIEAKLRQIQNQQLDLNSLLEKDLRKYLERDFACQSLVEALLFHRGFHTLASHRFAHLFWEEDQKYLSIWLANRAAELWGADIHPAAKIGVGLVIDHCIGIVIGETCKIGEDVFLFHNVTLGGTGHAKGDRHPKIGDHVVIGAGATILGNIQVGSHAVIAAGAMVLKEVPTRSMVAGLPAKVKGVANPIQ